MAIDEHADGTLIAEIDDRDEPSNLVPEWLDVVDDVSGEEAWTGVSLARWSLRSWQGYARSYLRLSAACRTPRDAPIPGPCSM